MRIDILAFGSLGDVQPYVALGLGLQKAGHRVRVVTLGGFEAFVYNRGLDHLSILGTREEIDCTAGARDMVAYRHTDTGFFRGLVNLFNSVIETGIASYWRACQDVEALIVSPYGSIGGGFDVAEALRVPLMRAEPQPFARPDWEARGNLAAAVRGKLSDGFWAAFRLVVWGKLRHTTNAARQNVLALPPLPLLREPFGAMDRARVPLLAAYSPAVVPRPPHWGDWIHVTGYWFLDTPPEWLPPSTLLDFLRSGPPPVFVGFGSLPFPNPEAITTLVIRALARAGRRGVLVAGGSKIPNGLLSDDILSVDYVPHSWLFPQVCAAVHHGGAGVTGAALRAGLPSVVVPVFADQPFWAQRVFQLGAGPPPIRPKRLTEDALASAILATDSKEMRGRAAALGAQIRSEDGVGRAVEAIHKYVSGT
jgi:UDP:flavonoid glycosyltransferase YjiC (YdhE family)